METRTGASSLWCVVVVLFLAFCCSLLSNANALSSTSNNDRDHLREETVDDGEIHERHSKQLGLTFFDLLFPELIVVFHRYMSAGEQKALLSELLKSVSGWEVVDRENPAYALPSDFALLKVIFF